MKTIIATFETDEKVSSLHIENVNESIIYNGEIIIKSSHNDTLIINGEYSLYDWEIDEYGYDYIAVSLENIRDIHIF